MFKKGAPGKCEVRRQRPRFERLSFLYPIDLRTQRVGESQLNCEKGLPPLLADRGQLHQVFVNLIMNAIEAMGSVTDRERQLPDRSASCSRCPPVSW